MSSNRNCKKIVEELLEKSGIEVNGSHPCDIHVHNEELYPRLLAQKNLALGEAYMEGWWDCECIDDFIFKVLSSDLDSEVKGNLKIALPYILAWLFNHQSRARSHQIADKHYNKGNDLFLSFLDDYNQYSCGFFNGCNDLGHAQERKLEMICKKLELRKDDRVLDIGCGWGGLSRYMAEHFSCSVTAVNISEEQIKYAMKCCEGLPVEVKRQDYRDISGRYDKVVSVGMFEHVGYKNYRTFMNTVERSLAKDGIFLLHTIGSNESGINSDLWLNRYIFPNGMLPSIAQISESAEGLFVIEDLHNMGPHYDRTLMCWHENFEKHWQELKSRYDETFRRMWKYYLLSCAGSFRARHIQLWQIVFTKPGRFQPKCRWQAVN